MGGGGDRGSALGRHWQALSLSEMTEQAHGGNVAWVGTSIQLVDSSSDLQGKSTH